MMALKWYSKYRPRKVEFVADMGAAVLTEFIVERILNDKAFFFITAFKKQFCQLFNFCIFIEIEQLTKKLGRDALA